MSGTQGGEGSGGGARAAVEQVLALHEQRVLTYKRWERAFKEYVAGEEQADGWEDYQTAVKEATGEFAKISSRVREQEAALAQPRPDLAAMVRTLQELEKQKLQLTVRAQAGREKAVFVTEKVDEEIDWVWEREEKDIKQQLHALVEEINLVIDSFRLELPEL